MPSAAIALACVRGAIREGNARRLGPWLTAAAEGFVVAPRKASLSCGVSRKKDRKRDRERERERARECVCERGGFRFFRVS